MSSSAPNTYRLLPSSLTASFPIKRFPTPSRSKIPIILVLSLIPTLTFLYAIHQEYVPASVFKEWGKGVGGYLGGLRGGGAIGVETKYEFGPLGKRLLDSYDGYRYPFNGLEGEQPIETEEHRQLNHPDMFDLMAGRDDSLCEGWSPEAESLLLLEKGSYYQDKDDDDDGRMGLREKEEMWKECWKSKMWHQLDEWDVKKSFIFQAYGGLRLDRNIRALNRLQRCLIESTQSPLPTYPPPPSSFRSSNITFTTDEIERDVWDFQRPIPKQGEGEGNDEMDLPCSVTATKVLVLGWWWAGLGFEDVNMAGESVWTRSQIKALYEQGYTILSTMWLEGVIEIHRALPDVISHIWIEDKNVLICQEDPRCIDFSTFKPTIDRNNTRYPDRILKDPEWLWSQEKLDAIPIHERGKIPLHKLFATTYWGTRPSDRYWQTGERFSWNPLGQEWTLSPFGYPNHTYIPYSIEEECMKVPFQPQDERDDHLFVLAKRTSYFSDRDSNVPRKFWPDLKAQTGLWALSVADSDDGKEVPEGVKSIGRVKKEEFEELVGKSKLMLGIGWPPISPSIYSALCQATPVLIPYHSPPWPEIIDANTPPLTGWQLFDGTQHGPALAIGEPYVYGYQAGNVTMLVEKIDRALEDGKRGVRKRFVPDDMTHAAELRNMDDYMRFDWAEHARLILETNNNQPMEERTPVIEHCFEENRCKKIKADTNGKWWRRREEIQMLHDENRYR